MEKVNANEIHQRMPKKEEKGRRKTYTYREGKIQLIYIHLCVLLKWDFRNSAIRYVWLIWFDCDFFSCSSSIINQIVLPWMAIVSVQLSTIQSTDRLTEKNHFQLTWHFHNFQYRKYFRFNHMILWSMEHCLWMAIWIESNAKQIWMTTINSWIPSISIFEHQLTFISVYSLFIYRIFIR